DGAIRCAAGDAARVVLAATDRDAEYGCLCRSRRGDATRRDQTHFHRLDVRCEPGPACGRTSDLRRVDYRLQRRAGPDCRGCTRGKTGGTATAAATTTAAATNATTAAAATPPHGAAHGATTAATTHSAAHAASAAATAAEPLSIPVLAVITS